MTSRLDEVSTLVFLSDATWAFSFLSLVSYVKQRPHSKRDEGPGKYVPIPKGFLAFSLLSSLIHVAAVAYPGAPVVSEIVGILKLAPTVDAKPFQLGVLVLDQVNGSYELMFALALLILNLSFVVAEVFSILTNLISASTRSELDAVEKATKEAEASRLKKKGKAGASKKALDANPEENRDADGNVYEAVSPASSSTKLISVTLGLCGIAFTVYACATSPLIDQISTPAQFFERLRNLIPCHFGVFSLLETLALVTSPQTLFARVNGKVRATGAGHALMIRTLAVVLFIGSNAMRSLPDPATFMLHQPQETQIHLLIVFLHLLALVLLFMPSYAEAHPVMSMAFFLYVASIFVCIVNPKIIAMANLKDRDLYVKVVTMITSCMAIILNGSYVAPCMALTAALFINVHSEVINV